MLFASIPHQPENFGPEHQDPGLFECRQAQIFYGRASKIILNGVSAARRNRVNPAFERTSRRRRSPACAPRARPTSWLSDAGVQIIVENP